MAQHFDVCAQWRHHRLARAFSNPNNLWRYCLDCSRSILPLARASRADASASYSAFCFSAGACHINVADGPTKSGDKCGWRDGVRENQSILASEITRAPIEKRRAREVPGQRR